MKIITLILIALFITGVSFADDRLERIPSMSGKVEVMDELGLVEHDNTSKQVLIPKAAKKSEQRSSEKLQIRNLADIMTVGD